MSVGFNRENHFCAICTEVAAEPTNLPCGHMFDLSCVREWLLRNRTCPTCRAGLEVRDIALIRIDEGHARIIRAGMGEAFIRTRPGELHRAIADSTSDVHRRIHGSLRELDQLRAKIEREERMFLGILGAGVLVQMVLRFLPTIGTLNLFGSSPLNYPYFVIPLVQISLYYLTKGFFKDFIRPETLPEPWSSRPIEPMTHTLLSSVQIITLLCLGGWKIHTSEMTQEELFLSLFVLVYAFSELHQNFSRCFPRPA